MVKIYIDTQSSCDWINDEICEMPFIAYGNNDYTYLEGLEWWKTSKEILREFCNYCSDDPYMLEILADYGATEEKAKQIIKVYDNCRHSESIETIVAVANVLYPEREFKTATIRGYCQRDWQEVAYEAKDGDLLREFEAMYFGMISEIYADGTSYIILDEDLWKIENDKAKILEYVGLESNTECEIYKSDGYITTTRWAQIA